MTTFSADALWNKSRVFIERAIQARDNDDIAEFHLWASISIELLGKSALAAIHPTLIADPTQENSMLAACGVLEPPVKRTIQANTVYKRLHALDPRLFSPTIKDTCDKMADLRNAELHSGESPFQDLNHGSLSPKLWMASEVILTLRNKTLEDWVGDDEAARIRTVIADASQLLRQVVASRVARRASEFISRFGIHEEERLEVLRRAAARPAPRSIIALADEVEEVECPACGAKAWLLGSKGDTEVVGTEYDDDHWPWDHLETTYYVDGFRCIECGLRLEDSDETSCTELPEEFVRESEELHEEEEYGND